MIAYWVTTIFGPVSFVIGDFLFITHGEHQVEQLNHKEQIVNTICRQLLCSKTSGEIR